MIPLQTGSPHPVTHIRFSPDGGVIAVAQPHHGVTLLERASGRVIATCAMPRRGVLTGLTFCDGGRYVAAASAKGLEVFDAATGRPVARNSRAACQGLRLAERDGVALGFGHDVCGPVWHPERPSRTEAAFNALMNHVGPWFVPSADGRLAVQPVGQVVKLYDTRTHRYTAVAYRAAANDHAACDFCPLGRRFAVNDGRTIDVFDIDPPHDDESEAESQSGLPVAPQPHVRLDPTFSLGPDRPSEAPGWFPPFALCADGRGLLVKRPRNRIQLWDAPTGTLRNEWSWRFEWVTCVAASADNLTAVAGGRHGRVLIWDLE
jgi:WD40 repeat protein